jgi:hypothetical protein
MQSIIKFQWKCLHIIVYSEYRLQKMGKSNGKYICKCHLCKNEIESLIHLFYPILIYKLPHPIKISLRLFLPHTGIPQGLSFLQQVPNSLQKRF